MAKAEGFSIDTPWRKLGKAAHEVVLYGSPSPVLVSYRNRYGRLRSYTTTFDGVIPVMERRYNESESDSQRERLEQYMREVPCRACKGERLKPESLAVTVDGLNISQLTAKSIAEVVKTLDHLELGDREHLIADRLLKEIRERLRFLLDVGLAYLTLARSSGRWPAARRSGSGWPRRSARRWSASSTSWTNRRSVCTSATTSA